MFCYIFKINFFKYVFHGIYLPFKFLPMINLLAIISDYKQMVYPASYYYNI